MNLKPRISDDLQTGEGYQATFYKRQRALEYWVSYGHSKIIPCDTWAKAVALMNNPQVKRLAQNLHQVNA